jgi:hypothetical protein
MPDHKIASWAEERLAADHGGPFMLSVGFFRPHVPMYAPRRWFDLHPREKIILPEARADEYDDIPRYARQLSYAAAAPRHDYVVSLGEWEHTVQAYLACVSFVTPVWAGCSTRCAPGPTRRTTLVALWGTTVPPGLQAALGQSRSPVGGGHPRRS